MRNGLFAASVFVTADLTPTKTMTVRRVLDFGRRKCRGLKHRYNAWQEKRFDRQFGITTAGIEYDLAALGATGQHLAQAEAYEPIQLPVFKTIMDSVTIDPRNYAFIDFGAGKGRALVLAAEQGFRHVIGIEFASSLYDLAARNIAAYRSRNGRAPPMDLVCADAVHFRLPDEDAMLFFYNPFNDEVLSEVCRNMEIAYRSRPRSLVIAYRNPRHSAVFDSVDFLTRDVLNETFAIYRAGAHVDSARG